MHYQTPVLTSRVARIRPGKEVGFVATKLTAIARPLLIVTALALMLDLMFSWRTASLHEGYINLDEGASPLGGWGGVAGAFLGLLIVFELFKRPKLSAIAALGAAAFVVVEFFTGSASASIGGVVAVSSETPNWPAYAGLCLALVLVGVAALRAFGPLEKRLPLPPALPRLSVRQPLEEPALQV